MGKIALFIFGSHFQHIINHAKCLNFTSTVWSITIECAFIYKPFLDISSTEKCYMRRKSIGKYMPLPNMSNAATVLRFSHTKYY